jgi:hypothetical protein
VLSPSRGSCHGALVPLGLVPMLSMGKLRSCLEALPMLVGGQSL